VARVRLAARYEWDQHVPVAQARGATDEQLTALDAGDIDHACFTAAQRAVLAFVADMVRDGEVPDGEVPDDRCARRPRSSTTGGWSRWRSSLGTTSVRPA